MPNKTIKPIDSLFCISSYIIEESLHEELSVDHLYERLQKTYPKSISIETTVLCLNYLFIIGKLDIKNEIIKIKI